MANHQLFLNDLKLNIEGDILTDKANLGLYSTDASVYRIEPIVVILPKHNQDVKTAMRIAADHKVTILPRGGGTSLAGQTVGHSMILDFSKYMNQVLELNEAEKWIRVQPGMVRDELNTFLQPYGLHFAPDPATSSRANVGGMIGNNSSGTKSILYGKTVDHVLGLNVVLADGTALDLENQSLEAYANKCNLPNREGEIYSAFQKIVSENEEEIKARFPKVMRRVQGYNLDEFVGKENWNLAKLICGSEGTLATILEAKINLEPLPKYKSVCVVHFSELLGAIQAVTKMLPFQPAAIEILDETVVRLSRENLITQRHCHFIKGNPAAIQIVEFYSDNEKDVLARPQQMIAEFKKKGVGYAYPLFLQGKEVGYDDVWVIRKKGLGLMLGLKGAKKPLPFIEDAGIPTDVLPEYIDKVLKICKKHDTDAAMYAHASVGVIHVRPILDLREAIDIERFKNIADETFELVKQYGGSWSGEHGDGLVRSFYLERYFGSQVYQALKSVKTLFDPANLMNPGKIVDAPPIDQNLRYGTTYQETPIDTHFHYRGDISFSNVVHTCTGVGECRKMNGGTMCPSFRATRDEEHSTRGRANALRLAMSGQLDQDGLSSKRLKETLDLCLSCKACKSECPSNVDMAKLKSEVLQKYYDTHGISMRERFIQKSANMAVKLSGVFSPIVNWTLKNALFRWGLDSVAGIDRRRILPSYTQQPFSQWFAKNYLINPKATQQVVLFADTYLNYHEPNIGIAATKLLSALGFEVKLAAVGCCQRPKISNGFLKAAKKDGAKTAIGLDDYLRQGLTVVVCEPSCLSALKYDLPDLLADEKLVQRLNNQIKSLEVFVANYLDNNPTIRLKSRASQLAIHGHCHQKALIDTKYLKAIFSKIDGLEYEEFPTGCCGMAGSFGYEKEHYDLSKKIAERSLIPALKAVDANCPIVANGFSCRHQIQDFGDKKARHWVEMVEIN